MNPHQIARLFPNASKSLLAANAVDYGPSNPATPPHAVHAPVVAPTAKKRAGGLAKPRGRRAMNKTEAAYAAILESEKQAGLWIRYDWEGITLRWPDGMTYSADFCAIAPENDNSSSPAVVVWLIETKGPWIEGDALVKFRAARAHWPEFHFKMMQRDKDGTWTQLL